MPGTCNMPSVCGNCFLCLMSKKTAHCNTFFLFLPAFSLALSAHNKPLRAQSRNWTFLYQGRFWEQAHTWFFFKTTCRDPQYSVLSSFHICCSASHLMPCAVVLNFFHCFQVPQIHPLTVRHELFLHWASVLFSTMATRPMQLLRTWNVWFS